MSVVKRRVAGLVGGGLAVALAISGCGSSKTVASSKASSSSSTGTAASVLGSPHAASGSPVVFGMISLETAPGGDFPQARLAAQAAVAYVNAYRGGLDGHPVVLDTCLTDGTASVSENCANQLIAKHPAAILGATDLASAATLPMFAKAGLVQIGGVDLTPSQVVAPNSIAFNDIALTGDAAEQVFIAKSLKAKKVGVIVEGDAEGISSANHFVLPVLKQLGLAYKEASIPPSVADATSGVASVTGSSPDAYFVLAPSQCVSIFGALKRLGNTKPVVTIDPCSSPGIVKASDGSVDGAWFSAPYATPGSSNPDVRLYNAILDKYAPATIARDSTSESGVQTVLNVWAAFHTTPVSKLTSAYMLKTLKTGSNHRNFLSSPYTCNGQAAPMFPAICDAVQYMHRISPTGTVIQPTNTSWSGIRYLLHH